LAFILQDMKKLRIGILSYASIDSHLKGEKEMKRKTSTALKSKSTLVATLVRIIREKGHSAVKYDPQNCQLYFDNKGSKILYKNKEIKGADMSIPRLNVYENLELEISFLRQFQLMEIPVINKYLPILKAMNKLRSLQILTEKKIPVPKTVIVRRFEYLDEAIKLVGGYPVVIKTPFGTHGKGVAIIESRRSMHSALDILWKYSESQILLIQEYVAESNGCDYRAFVMGDEVVASMKRCAPQGDFRSNLHIGGAAEACELSPMEKDVAIKTAKAMKLDYCGVDLLRAGNKPVVMEVNPNPGLAGISNTSGINMFEKLVDFAISKAII